MNSLDGQLTEMMKTQERIAIAAILQAQAAIIMNKEDETATRLQKDCTSMHTLTRNATSDLKEGLEGKAADSADSYLATTTRDLTLHNPITNK
ncbi:MAG: hypothetical protein SOI66_05980 [Bifidobacterium sp.]